MASKWEDTVMNKAEITQSVADLLLPAIISVIKARCEAQAEITWHSRDGDIEEAEKRGAEKVVAWVNAHKSRRSDFMTPGEFHFGVNDEDWQAFLKDLGIEVKE